MTGLEFLDQQSAEKYNFEAIILTGRTDAAALMAIAKSGKSWIGKPAEPDIIAAIITWLSAKARSRRGETHNLAI